MSAVRRGLSVTLLALACGWGGVLAGVGVSAPGVPPGGERITVDRDNLWTISAQLTGRYPGASRAQIMVALMRANPDAFVQGNVHRLRVQRPLVLPSVDAVQAEPRALASELVQQHRKAMAEGSRPQALPDLAVAPGTAAPVVATPVPVAPTPTPVVPDPASAPAPVVTAPSVPGVVQAPPVQASAVEPAVAPPVVTPPASMPAEETRPPAATPSGDSRGWIWGLVGLAGAGVVLLWWGMGRQRRSGEGFEESRSGPPSTLLRQQVISNAAADMARAVETARGAHVMVNPPLSQGVATLPPKALCDLLSVDDRRLQLLIAQTWVELGRVGDARQVLERIREAPDAEGLQDEVDDLWLRLPADSAQSAA